MVKINEDVDVQQQAIAALAALANGANKVNDRKAAEVLRSDQEAQNILGCSRTTLFRMRRDGQIRFVKVRGLVRYQQSELDRVISGHTQEEVA